MRAVTKKWAAAGQRPDRAVSLSRISYEREKNPVDNLPLPRGCNLAFIVLKMKSFLPILVQEEDLFPIVFATLHRLIYFSSAASTRSS